MTLQPETTSGTLREGEPHPVAYNAKEWVSQRICAMSEEELAILRESLASTALSGNRTAEICGETLSRLLSGQPVSDRYLLGLAWFLQEMEEKQ